ncbi:PAS domain-containing protein [Halomicroarcula limicola]|uniref:PAS domain-containing protein n=1 Tax=Haloarcula limicola TaxID=1429915 RepID=A0A8J7YFH0_9EURY|nr:PAS domain-containing protein [Halomicroarcula limicola]MBV0926256.1 PAS domain-containing protein [Halomicroarcula limicola]
MANSPLTDALRETLVLFEEAGVPWTTTEVADRLDLGRRSTYERLERLVDADRLDTKKVGGNGRVWWRPREHSDSATPDWEATTGSLASNVLDTADVGIFILDSEFEVAWINEAAERYFGIEREWVLGQAKRTLVDESIAPVIENSESFVDTVLATYEDNTDTERFECHVTPGDGREERWLEHRSTPIDSGAYTGGRVELYYDVTDRKREESAHRTDRKQLASLVNAVEEYAIFLLDPDGHVQTWNPGAARIKGYDAEDIIGEHISTFYTNVDCTAGVPAENLAKAAEKGWIEDEGWRMRADGSRFWANVTITAIRDDDGTLDGYAKVTRDMTSRRERERQLRRERDLTDRIVNMSPVGIMVLDSDGNHVRINERAKDVLEIPDNQTESYSRSDRTVYDVDGNLVSPDEHPAARTLETGEAVFDWEAKVELPDGGHRWLSVNAAPVFDDNGVIERVIVTGEDITRLKSQAQRLERQRDDLESELETIFERVDDGFVALDDDLRFTYVNERAGEFLKRSPAELLGTYIWEALEPGSKVVDAFEEALETQQSLSFEEFYDPIGAWFESHVYPSEDGLSVYFRDVTRRKERERQLEEYETIVETVADGVYAVDENYRFTAVNEGYTELVGYDREELLGSHITAVVDEEALAVGEQRRKALLDSEDDTGSVELEIETATGERLTVESRYAELPSDGEFEGTAGVVRDITDRKKRERQLEEYRRHFETLIENFPAGAVALVDENLRYTTFAGTPEGATNVTRADLEGSLARDVLPSQIADVVIPRYEDALSGQSSEFRDVIDGRIYQFHFVPVRDDDGDIFAATAMSQDITELKTRERELETRVRQQEVVTNLGQRALADRDLDELMAEAAELVAETLDNDYCKVLDLDADAEELLLRQGVGWDDGIVGEATVSSAEADSQAAYTLASKAPVSTEDLDTETRFSGPDLLTNHDVHSGISTIIGPHDDPWGILGTHDTECTRFSDHDINFVQSISNILAGAIESHGHERELLRQREELAALNNINQVVQGITDAVIDQSTREEIETIVCERLAAADSYSFAWIGDVDATTETVDLRAEAGVEGYLDDITITIDPDDDRSKGPTGRAFHTGEVQTLHELSADDRYDPWRSTAEEYGFRSSAAIPIVHENTTYGVLNVYAERPNAFRGHECNVIVQLGEIVGHAIAAVERKRALLSDEVVELQFQIENVFESLGIDGRETEPIYLEQTVPIANDDYLLFGRTTPAGIDTVEKIVEGIPFYESVTFRDDGDEVVFELRVSEPPILSVIASLGGSIPEAVIEGGDYRLTVHLPPSGDVREVIDQIQEVYPNANLLKRHQRSLHGHGEPTAPELMSDLTARQRSALETAFHTGFFQWPRETSGEEVASLLDVSPPTFHQHLRKAEQKVFESVLSSRTSTRTARRAWVVLNAD